MTRDELNRRRMMFQIYSNRNKMPQLQKNANEEPVAHSATNDFLEYRKKVAAGTRMQRENNKSNLFNVTAANEQYHQDLMDQNIIIHAGMNNQYIAKLDDFYGKGKPRYFYDQAEWDNYRKNMQGARQTGADRGAREGADAKNKALANNAQQAFSNANRNSILNTAQSRKEEAIKNSQKNTNREKNLEANQSGREASANGSSTKAFNDAKNKDLANKAQEAFTKSSADYKNKDLTNKAQEAFNNSPAANTEFRTSTDAYKNKDLLESNQKSKENTVKKSDPKYQKELEKAKSIKEDKDRWGAYSESDLKEISKDKRFSNIKTEDDAVNYPGGVEKLYNDLEAALEEKFPGKKKNYEASKNAGADRAAKESKAANDQKADKINKKNWEHNARQNGITKIEEDGTVWRNAENAGRDRAEKELINRATDPNDPKLNKLADSFTSNSGKARTKKINLVMNRQDKNGVEYSVEPAKKKAKHSSLEDGITTSDDITPDQEYLNFRARVEAGMKHFGMTRGLMSVPVNQALKNGESLSHAGMTNKYYAKLDDFWGKGKPRYFYSKEEWDGYQKNKQGAGQAEAARGAKDHAKVAGEIAARKEKAIKDAQSYKEATSKTSDDTKNYFKNIDNTALAEKANTAYNKAWTDSKRNKFLNDAQSGREAAINNSSPLANGYSSNSSSNNSVKKFANKLIDAINNKGTSDKVVTTVIVEDNTPEIVQKAQSGREAAEKEATKRTMTTMAYNKAVKDYDEVAKEIDKEYGFDKLDPRDAKAVNKTWQKLIKDTAKVIDSGKVDNPNNVKYEYQLIDDDANSYAWAAYIQEYASESLRLNSIYNDLQNEYAKTLQTAQAMHDFDAIAESNKHASELFDQMQKVQEQMKENAKENDAKVLPYLAAVYKELL